VEGSAWLPLAVNDLDGFRVTYQTFALVNPIGGAFTLMPTPGIDPTVFADQTGGNYTYGDASLSPYFEIQNGVVTSITVVGIEGEGFVQLGFRINQTTSLAGFGTWVNLPGFLNSAAPSFSGNLAGPTVLNGAGGLLVSAEASTPQPHSQFATYFFGNASPPLNPWIPVQITFRGAKMVPVNGKQEVCCESPTQVPVKRAI
jgi:hypothetical protein